uniref:F-box domain-containing protein n=1 Tax=Odontella aurita TaxID=265563 RepID=A0A7S4NED3_9STRA
MAEVFGLKRPKKSSSAKIPEPASEEALAQLMLSSDAAAAAAEGDDAEGEVDDNADDVKTMDMVYHLMVPFLGAQKDADETKISDAITTTLSQNGCAISSLSYVVIDGHIAFDRHRGGLLTPPKSRADSVGDSDADVNGDSTDALSGEEALYLAHLTSHLPAHILEWVLTFLPDSATASLPRVCRGWRDEIGRSSPELWRTLLRRHGWPEPAPRIEDEVQAEAGGGGDESERDRYRRAFVGHYAGLGSLAALKVGMESLEAKDRALSRRGGRLASSREYACLADIPAGGPDVGGERCVAFKSWSSGKVLGAYNNDNTVRLYEAAAVATSCGAKGGGGGSAICREAVRVRPAPFPVSKRTRCELRAMDLDDDLVGCLFRVVSSRRGGGGGEDDERETGGDSRGKSGAVPVPWLTAARRDDVLCASSSGGRGRGDKAADLEEEELLRKFDLREAVVNFLLSLENRDGVPDDLFHFLARNSPSRVIVDVFPDLVACGGGRFLFEAAIVIPRRGEDEDDDSSDDDDSDHLPPPPALAARRLCLFSVGGGRVTWMCDSDPTLSSQFLGAAVRLGGSGPASARGPCHAAFTSSETAVSVRVAVSRGGDVQLMRSSTEQESVDYAILAWDVTPVSYAFVGWRPVAVTKSHVVVGHTILVSLPGERLLPRMVLMFCPVSFTSEEDESLLPTLTLKRVGEIVDIVPVRDSDHVIVLHCSDNEGAEGDGADLADNGDADVDRPDNLNFTSASLVHVPTQSLVGQPVRLCGEDVSVMLCSGAGTLALDVFGESVVLAGSAVRDVADACLGAGAEQRSEGRDKAEAKKKKKKRLAGHAKGRQKDGFARGMSLRG